MMVNLARGFAKKELNVNPVMVRAEGSYLAEVTKEERVVDLKAKRDFYSIRSLVRYICRERPEAMLSMLNHVGIAALRGQKIFRVLFQLITQFTQSFYSWADAVISLSQGVETKLIKVIGLPQEKVMTIHNPTVTPEIFITAEEPLDHSWFAPGDPPQILGVGRFTAQKDSPTLIRAFATMNTAVPEVIFPQITALDRTEQMGRYLKNPKYDSIILRRGCSARDNCIRTDAMVCTGREIARGSAGVRSYWDWICLCYLYAFIC